MSKQTKVAKLKEQVTEVLKPLAVAVDGQAPSVPFAPYANEEYTEPYASVLLEKANALAGKIWGSKESYVAQHFTYPIGKTEEEKSLIEKNKSYFNSSTVSQVISRMLSFNLNNVEPNSFYDHIKISELIKKLKRLEKKYGSDEIIDEDVRDQLISNILMPTNMYGIFDHHFGGSVQFRYPSQKSVVNDILTEENMQVIESVIFYIPRIRSLLATFKPAGGYPVKAKRLLKDWMLDPKKYSSVQDEQRFLSDLLNFANFFSCALPYNVKLDLVPALKYPTMSSQNYDKLRKASATLRDMALGYVQERNSLSDLLQAIVDLKDALHAYFSSVASEVDACFNFISRIGVPFDKLVEESKARIDNAGCPF